MTRLRYILGQFFALLRDIFGFVTAGLVLAAILGVIFWGWLWWYVR